MFSKSFCNPWYGDVIKSEISRDIAELLEKCRTISVLADDIFKCIFLAQLTSLSPSNSFTHNSDVIMRALASQITSVWIVCSTVCSGADQRKHQSSASVAFVRGIHRWPMNSPHKGPVTRKMFPFDDVIMWTGILRGWQDCFVCQSLLFSHFSTEYAQSRRDLYTDL